MTETPNLRLVRAFIQAWNERDIEGIMQRLASDIFYHNIPMPALCGLDAVRGTVERVCASSSRIDWIIISIAESHEGVVLTERIDNFTLKGRAISMPVMGSFRCKDGKIAVWKDYFDLGQYQRQLAGDDA